MLVSKTLLSTIVTASKDDTRPLLTCIRVYKEGENIVSVATDGYILSEVIEKTPDVGDFPNVPISDHTLGEADDVLVPAETAKKMIAAIKKSDTLPVLNYAALTSESITTTDLEMTTMLHFKSPDGNYPEYRKLVDAEEKKPRSTITINPKYLKQALALFKDDTSVEISVPTYDPMDSSYKNGAVLIKSTAYETKKTAVIMPLKS